MSCCCCYCELRCRATVVVAVVAVIAATVAYPLRTVKCSEELLTGLGWLVLVHVHRSGGECEGLK